MRQKIYQFIFFTLLGWKQEGTFDKKYKPEGDFSLDERIDNLVSLSGIYPLSLVIEPETLKKLEDKYIPPIGDHDEALGDIVWFIPRSIEEKKTKNGKVYWILRVTDSSNKITQVKCWVLMQKRIEYL